MNGPAESLRADLQRIDETLEPFATPVTDERPGLRWMAEVLRGRRTHVLGNLRDAETTRLEVEITSTRDHLGLTALAELLAALQRAVYAAGDLAEDADGDVRRRGLTFEATGIDVGASQEDRHTTWTLALRRAAGPHAAQPVTEEGGLLVDAALASLVEALENRAVEPLADVVRRHGLAIELRTIPVTGSPGRATLDQGAAR